MPGGDWQTQAVTDPNPTKKPRAAVIGAGPAGLMAAEVLAGAGVAVTIYDACPRSGANSCWPAAAGSI